MNIIVPFTARVARKWLIARSAEASVMNTGNPNRRRLKDLRIAMSKWLPPGVVHLADANGQADDQIIPILISTLSACPGACPFQPVQAPAAEAFLQSPQWFSPFRLQFLP